MKHEQEFKRMLKIKRLQRCIDSDADFAERLGWSPANYSNKMHRCNFRISELEQMADALNCDLKIEFVDK